MTKAIYKIFDLTENRYIGTFCFIFAIIGFFITAFIGGNKPVNDYYYDFLIIVLPPLIPTMFFIAWFILAIFAFCIEKFVIAPIEFVVYKLGIPKIKINVDVIWKYQQKD